MKITNKLKVIFLSNLKRPDLIIARILLFLLPLVMFWFMTLMESELRKQHPVNTVPTDNLILLTPKDRNLDEILAQPAPSMELLDQMFLAYGNYYKINPKQLRHLALCESRFRPYVTNGQHAGMFQYNPRTWSATRERMGLDPNPDLRFDAEESIKTTAYKIANEGSGAWVVCSNKFFGRS